MKSRKPTSQARLKQDLPKDSIKLIKEVVEKNFKPLIEENNVVVDGSLYPQEIVIMIGFRSKNGVKQFNFNASVSHDIKKKNTMTQIYISVDALGSMIQEYIDSEGDLELPTDWTEFSLEGQKVFMKYDTINTELESEADKILNPEE